MANNQDKPKHEGPNEKEKEESKQIKRTEEDLADAGNASQSQTGW